MGMELKLYQVDANYIKYLHKKDYRVSVKYNNRPFVGIITMISGVKYVLPLTSQTTQIRKTEGKAKRAALITTFVRDNKGEEIANILHNNMFPVKEGVYTQLNVDAKTDTYESNEIRFIRKNSADIIKKAQKVHDGRIAGHNPFLNKTCCDFNKLEREYMSYNS